MANRMYWAFCREAYESHYQETGLCTLIAWERFWAASLQENNAFFLLVSFPHGPELWQRKLKWSPGGNSWRKIPYFISACWVGRSNKSMLAPDFHYTSSISDFRQYYFVHQQNIIKLVLWYNKYNVLRANYLMQHWSRCFTYKYFILKKNLSRKIFFITIF